MSVLLIRQAIVQVLGTVPNVGMVQPYERYAANLQQLKQFYWSATHNAVRGCYVRRLSAAITGRIDDEVEHIRWRIVSLMAIDDDAQSELTFDALLDAKATAFRADDTLNDTVAQCTVPADGGGSGEAGLQLEDSGPAMFGGVLCHVARLSLNTIRYLEAP